MRSTLPIAGPQCTFGLRHACHLLRRCSPAATGSDDAGKLCAGKRRGDGAYDRNDVQPNAGRADVPTTCTATCSCSSIRYV